MGAARLRLSWVAAVAGLLTACGGGGSSLPADGGSPAPDRTTYANSVVVGASTPQTITYTAAAAASQATLTSTVASSLLPLGTTPVLAEHVDASLPGVRVACVSGHGDTTNVIGSVNLGVIAESAAVLLDSGWHEIDARAAWNTAVASGGAWLGWENCGVKPEGAPSPSSRLVPTAAGGYTEDVFDGNPGTTFQTIRRNVSPAEVATMVSPSGLLAVDDPLRPLQLLLRAYRDGAGRVILVQTGAPASGAAVSARGFVALYVPGP